MNVYQAHLLWPAMAMAIQFQCDAFIWLWNFNGKSHYLPTNRTTIKTNEKHKQNKRHLQNISAAKKHWIELLWPSQILSHRSLHQKKRMLNKFVCKWKTYWHSHIFHLTRSMNVHESANINQTSEKYQLIAMQKFTGATALNRINLAIVLRIHLVGSVLSTTKFWTNTFRR